MVGGGNSGFQIAEELAGTRPVELSVGSAYPALPQRLLGRDLFWWLTRSGLMRVTVGSRLGRRAQNQGDPHRHQPPQPATGRRPVPPAAGRRRRPTRSGSPTAPAARRRSWSGRPATGFDHSWIDVPGVLRDGRVIHTRGITEVPGLYFLGLPWQHTRGSALLGFVADDAAHVAAHVARTAVAMNSGQVPRQRGAPDAQAAHSP